MGGYLIVCCEFGTDFILTQKQNLISTYCKKEGRKNRANNAVVFH